MASSRGPRARSWALILALSGLTLALGFAVQVALAAALGTGREMDVYLVAVTVPTLLAVLALAVFPSYLVPVLQARAAVGGPCESAALTWVFARRTAVAALGLVATLELAAPVVVRLVAPGFAGDEARQATILLRIMLAGSFFDLLRGVLSAVEYAREKFLLPQLAPSLNHAALLASALLLLRPFGLVGLAAGWSVGSLLMFLMVLPALRGVHLFRRSPRSSAHSVESIGGGFLPIVLVAGFAQLSPVIDRLVASLLPVGSISYLGYGSKLLEVLMRTVPMAVALSAFPVLSAHAARGDGERMRGEAVGALRLALLGAVPLALTVLVFRVPLVQVLLQRGAFDAASTRHVATACAWYAVAFVPATVAYVLTQVSFALKRSWFLARILAASSLATAVLDLALARRLGFAGVAMAFAAVSAMQALILWGDLQRRLRLAGATWTPFLGQLTFACTTMTGGWVATTAWAGRWGADRSALWLGLNAAIGAAVFAGALWSAGNAEARAAAAAVTRAVRERRPGAGA